MARLPLPSLDRISGLPADVIGALRMVPEIVENTRAMERHTSVLVDVATVLRRVAEDTKALAPLRDDMASVAEATSVLEAMDNRMAAIQEAMPVLVEVQRHLTQLPETMGHLDEGLMRLSGLVERILIALEELNDSVDTLQVAVEPMGRLASRMPGRRKS